MIDATGLLHRAYHASAAARPPTPNGGLRGLVGQLMGMLSKARSRLIVVVLDTAEPSFRQAIEPTYKSGRKPPAPELVAQLEVAPAVMSALGFLTLAVPGFEADDVLATLAARARVEGVASWIVSPDKDVLQLVDDAPPPTSVFQLHRRARFDAAAVVERLGVPPERVVDYLALVGDPSDSLSGVKGVGPKAAREVIGKIGSLEEVYRDIEKVARLPVRAPRALVAKLQVGRETAFATRGLLTLRRDVPLELHGPLAEIARWTGPREDAEGTLRPLGLSQAARSLSTVVRPRR